MSPKKGTAGRTWDVVVVGGGPAGLTAGFYLSRAGFRTLLLERDRLGGQAGRIPVLYNYPGFPEGVRGNLLMRRLSRQALRWGLGVGSVEVSLVKAVAGGWRTYCRTGEEFGSRSVVLATGAEFLPLAVPGRHLLWQEGLGHAVFGEASRFTDKTVAVVGGGETAAHQALALAGHARRVHLLARGPALKAIAPLRKAVARHPRIRACYNSRVSRVLGSGSLDGLEWLDRGGKTRRLRLDAVFVLVGKRPRLPRLAPGRRKGLFVAGDAREGNARQVVAAAADGMSKAMECERYLNDQSDL